MTTSDEMAPDAVVDAVGSGDTDGEPEPEAPEKGSRLAFLGPVAPYVPGRRDALLMLGGAVLGGTTGAGGYAALGPTATLHVEEPEPEQRNDKSKLTSKEAKLRLVEGNERFVKGESRHPDQSLERREELAGGQHPFAAVLSCADSRVPPEVLFDQGLGDLFVVRAAGQVIDHAVLGSLQYGIEHLHAPLLVVLGHSSCGAVKAAVEFAQGKIQATGTDIDALIAAILPAVKEASEVGAKEEELLEVSIGINVEKVVEQLKKDKLLGEFAVRREVKIIGAEYDLETGEVDWQ